MGGALRRQGGAGQRLGGGRGAGRVEDAAAGARAADARPGHGADRQAPPVPRALRGGLRRRRPARRRCSSSSSPTAAGASTCREPVIGRALFHADNCLLPARTSRSPAACAARTKTSQTAFRGFGGPQGMLVIEEILDRVARALGAAARRGARAQLLSRRATRTHYGQLVRRRRPHRDASGASCRRRSDFDERRARDRRASTPRSPHAQARPRDHAGEVRHLVHRDVLQPGRRAGADLSRRQRAGEPRRHRDGPGPAHQDPADRAPTSSACRSTRSASCRRAPTRCRTRRRPRRRAAPT